MNDKDKIALVYTGDEVTIARLKINLEMQGVIPIIKDGFRQGINAGFVGGVSSAIDLFVLETDLEKASEIINAIIEE